MNKKVFCCQDCGHEPPKWLGRCPNCNQWNTIVEEIKSKQSNTKGFAINSQAKPTLIQNIENNSNIRLPTLDPELDMVLGGGLVEGSIILLGGEPGIGKSTLLLQLVLNTTDDVLYVSGEKKPPHKSK